MTKKIKTAVFPVGGFGTRFLPATKSIPKEMLPVAEKPLIQYAFEEALNAGIERFIFVTGRNKNAIENHFDNAYELQDVLNKRKKEEMLEKTAKDFVGDEPFAVTLADEMIYRKENDFLKQMIDLYEKKGENCNIVATKELNEDEDVSRYGVIKPKSIKGNVSEIVDMVEKPKAEEAPSRIILTGRYIFEPEIFHYLEKTEVGAGNEIQITDAMKSLMSDLPFYGLSFEEDRFDCGQIVGYLEANIAFALSNPKIEKDVKKVIEKFYKKIK